MGRHRYGAGLGPRVRPLTPGPDAGLDAPADCGYRPGHVRILRAIAATATLLAVASASPGGEPELVWIPGGEFTMGGDDRLARPDEQPKRRVRVDGFWIGATEVTNARFAAFVEATGHVTTAERPVDWEELREQLPPGTERPADEVLEPGALVFVMPAGGGGAIDLRSLVWWEWTHGADWRHPEGPGSDLEGRMDHPVVHVSWDDAVAYCGWAGGRLPTEAEWELAARGGLEGAVHPWGDGPITPGRANVWQGEFPMSNTGEDGYERTNPVRAFPPNGHGLYGVAGNVWEWCSDRFSVFEYGHRAAAIGPSGVDENPAGPERSIDPRNPHCLDSRTQRGGSFLCHESYCASYRVSARMGCSPDTGMSHVGFRIVKNGPPPDGAPADNGAE